MKKITRREFLRLLALGAGSAGAAKFLGACGSAPASEPATATNTPFFPGERAVSTETAVPATAIAATPTETPVPSEAATATPEPAYLAVAHGGDDPGALVRYAVEAIGGIGRFVPAGANVLIKPNVCTSSRYYQYAATTNPWVVGALVKMCLDAGANRVLVYDFPFNGSGDPYVTSGIAEQVLAAGGELEYASYAKFIPTQMPGNQLLTSASIYSEVLDADVVIDVPIAKNHGTTGLTLGMKNLMGTVYNRGAMHNADIHRQIAELTAYLLPKIKLSVIDAVRILLADGPLGGSLSEVSKIDTVIASADIVAADAAATRLFSGFDDPNWIRYIKLGAQMGLGHSDLDNLDIRDIAL